MLNNKRKDILSGCSKHCLAPTVRYATTLVPNLLNALPISYLKELPIYESGSCMKTVSLFLFTAAQG